MRIYGETDRMEVIVDTDRMEVIIVEKWNILFESFRDHGWGPDACRLVKQGIKDLVYMIWDKKGYATINSNQGNSFNQFYGKKPFMIRTRIEFVSHGEHWKAYALLNKDDRPQIPTGVDWDKRIIILNDRNFHSLKNKGHFFMRQGQQCLRRAAQCVVAHEFGHTIGNIAPESGNTMGGVYTGDEYVKFPSVHGVLDFNTLEPFPLESLQFHNYDLHEDIESIMNIGNEIRHRHFAHLRDVLQKMLPGSYFAINV